MHSCCDYAAITSLRCRVASARPRRIPPKSWNCKWPQVKLRSELTISEQCSENISHSMLLPIKNKDRHTTVFFLFHNVGALYNRLPVPHGASTVESLAWRIDPITVRPELVLQHAGMQSCFSPTAPLEFCFLTNIPRHRCDQTQVAATPSNGHCQPSAVPLFWCYQFALYALSASPSGHCQSRLQKLRKLLQGSPPLPRMRRLNNFIAEDA